MISNKALGVHQTEKHKDGRDRRKKSTISLGDRDKVPLQAEDSATRRSDIKLSSLGISGGKGRYLDN